MKAKRSAAVILASALVVSMAAGCGNSALDGSKTVVTINGTQVPMGIVSLMTRYQQARMEALYRMFGYNTGIWGTEEGEETSYGETMVQSSLEQVERLYLLKEKASDYGIALSQEDEEKIDAAASAFIDANSEEALTELAVTKDQVAAYLELETIESLMHEAIKAEADTEVDEAEAQQSSFTYFNIAKDEAYGEDESFSEEDEVVDLGDLEDMDQGNAEDPAEAAEEEAADTQEASDEAAADTQEGSDEETAEEEEASDEAAADAKEALTAREQAEAILEAWKADPAGDIDAVASEITPNLLSSTGTFTTKETDNEHLANTMDAAVIDALRTLSDGEVYDGIIETDTDLYVVRLDLTKDEEATASKIEDVKSEMQESFYTETVDGWLADAKIKVNDKFLSQLKVNDYHTFTIVEKTEETETDESAEAVAEEAETTDDAAADEAKEETAEKAETEEKTEAAEEAEAAEEGSEEVAGTEAAEEAVTEAAEEAVTEAAEEAVAAEEAKAEAAEETEETTVEEAK